MTSDPERRPPNAAGLDQKQAPLVTDIIRRVRQGHLSFHMPGHKQKPTADPRLTTLWGPDLFRADLSEMGGLDYLHEPRAALRRAQELAAAAFGAQRTFFLVNGTTVGNQAALLSSVGPGQKVLVPRASHRSVFGALMLADATPVFIPPLVHPALGLPLATDFSAAEGLVREHPDVVAIHLTSPSYYGCCSDVAAFGELAHGHGCPLIVDEAHGSHFAFHPALPASGLSQGADVVIQSTHKTLGALTQASMLHLGSGRVDPRRVQQALTMLQSSSPSALLTASLDAARAEVATCGPELLTAVVAQSEEAREAIRNLPGLWCYGRELVGQGAVAAVDPTKLLVRVSDLGVTGFAAAAWLRDKRGIEVELADLQHVLCTMSIADPQDAGARLVAGLAELAQTTSQASPTRTVIGRDMSMFPELPRAALTLREAFFGLSRAVGVRQASGAVCAEFVIPYPPGIPALLPGEIVEPAAIEYLEALLAAGATISGAEDHRLRRLRIMARG